MKRFIILLISQVTIILTLSQCYDCHDCIASGESFDLPYLTEQTVTFVNDNNEQKIFTVKTGMKQPPNQYCGRIGSESWGACGGNSYAFLKGDTLSPIISMRIKS